MTFQDIPDSVSVFVDANTLIYALLPDPHFGPTCAQLLQRIENQQLIGYTSAHIIAAMAHRLMTLEAARLLGRPPTGLANWLKRHPANVQQLARYRQAIDELRVIGLQVLPVTGPYVSLAADISRLTGLLTNDALIVTIVQHHGLTLLASNDADFDRVPGLTRFSPL